MVSGLRSEVSTSASPHSPRRHGSRRMSTVFIMHIRGDAWWISATTRHPDADSHHGRLESASVFCTALRVPPSEIISANPQRVAGKHTINNVKRPVNQNTSRSESSPYKGNLAHISRSCRGGFPYPSCHERLRPAMRFRRFAAPPTVWPSAPHLINEHVIVPTTVPSGSKQRYTCGGRCRPNRCNTDAAVTLGQHVGVLFEAAHENAQRHRQLSLSR
jgi:hypothetical protein